MQREPDSTSGEVLFLHQLIDRDARIAGDIVSVDVGTWAIHGTIPVDGDVIMAEFHELGTAREVLDSLRPTPPGRYTDRSALDAT